MKAISKTGLRGRGRGGGCYRLCIMYWKKGSVGGGGSDFDVIHIRYIKSYNFIYVYIK